MKKNFRNMLKLMIVATLFILLGACASTNNSKRIDPTIEEVQNTAEQALSAARDAQATANEAAARADAAQEAANEALERTTKYRTKTNRMFEKAMHK